MRQEFWYIVSGLDIQPEQSKNDKSCTQKIRSKLRNTMTHTSFFSVGWYSTMAQWLRRVVMNRAIGIRFRRVLISLQPGHFAWHRARQCTDTRFSISAIYIIFFYFDFVSGDLALTGFYIWLPLFWSTWSRARGQPEESRTRPRVQAWRMGVIIAIVEPPQPRSKVHKRCLALICPWIVEKTWKQGPTERVFQPSPPRRVLLFYLYVVQK